MISGNAETYYRTGIKFSAERWGVSNEDIDTYLAQPAVVLPSDASGKLVKIAEQKWIALFSVATEAYLDLRRTKLPDIFKNGLLITYTFPLRFRYPGNELGQNKNAYDVGVATLVSAIDDEFPKYGCCNNCSGKLV